MKLIDTYELMERVSNWFVVNRNYHLYLKPSDIPITQLPRKNDIPVTELRDILDRMDGVEFEPVKHGEWIFQRYSNLTGNAEYECSVCHYGETHVPSVEVNYCWHCGADMRGKENG